MNIRENKGTVTSGENMPYWIESAKPPEFSPLDKDSEADVLVVGGGLAGLTTAYCLLKAGKTVILVEDGLLGSGESGRTTAHITAALDDGYDEIANVFGEEGSKVAAESHTDAINFVETVVNKESINCDFKRVDGFLFLHPSDKRDSLEKEFDATRRAGLSTEWIESVQWVAATDSPAIRFPQQAQFHIIKYLTGLATAVINMGGAIYTNTRAEKISIKGSTCNGHNVVAKSIVVATNTPVNDMVTMHTKQMPFRSYVIGAKVPKGKLPYSLWWDTGDVNSKWFNAPYHYVRLQELDNENDLLIAGGEDHKTGQADDEGILEEDRYDALIEWTRKHFPAITDIVYKWSGQVMEPLDYMAFIGRNPGDDNIYIATGDSGNGMTHATIAGILITDLILGKENKWEKLYSPKRIPVKLPGRFLSEAWNMTKQYGDFIKKGNVEEANELANGEGGVLSKGLKKIALYRDEHGELHSYSAICPHLGCVLQWNGEEKTFDCPCHGSRFTKEGNVINGPAISNLEQIKIS